MANTNKELHIRIFGAENCVHCKRLIEDFSRIGVPYKFVDANAEENQSMCDAHNVDNLPHTQCLSSSDEVLFQHVGPISAQEFMNKLAEKITGKKGTTFKGRDKCKNCNRKK
jgi:hypothetical protein